MHYTESLHSVHAIEAILLQLKLSILLFQGLHLKQNTNAVPVERETLKSGQDWTMTDGRWTDDDAGRTDVKVEIFMQMYHVGIQDEQVKSLKCIHVLNFCFRKFLYFILQRAQKSIFKLIHHSNKTQVSLNNANSGPRWCGCTTPTNIFKD